MQLRLVLGGNRAVLGDPPGDRVMLGNLARLDSAARAQGDIEVAGKDRISQVR